MSYKYGKDNDYTSLIDVASLKQDILDELNMGNAVPSSLTVFKMKTTYFVGDIYSNNDLSVFVQYTNGRTVQTSNYTLSVDTVDTSQPGTTEVTVTYIDDSGDFPITLTYSLKVTVKYPEVVSIVAHKLRTKYNVDDDVNVEDVTVIGYYDNGDVKDIVSYTTNVDSIDMTTEGNKQLVVTYEKQDGTKITYTIQLEVVQV